LPKNKQLNAKEVFDGKNGAEKNITFLLPFL